MELGEKLRLARQEAGLSQRQLCGDIITRNMLSQIEHGTAHPSMATLRYLAGQLGKPLSYFLEEDAVLSPNQSLMEQAKNAFAAGETEKAWLMLQAFRQPDPMLEWEWKYLCFMTALERAQDALKNGKHLYSRQILEEASDIDHGIPGLERHRLLLLSRIPGTDLKEIAGQLPSVDEELLLRAEAALVQGEADRAIRLLSAAENREIPKWNLLQGRAMLLQNRYESAAQYLENAEPSFPKVCWPMLETCFRELGDYQQAYMYACKQK